LFCFLILQREIITLRTAHAKRREAVLTPWVHRALSGGGAGPAALHLKQMLRRTDRRVVRDVLLQLALDLRGEDAEHIARLYWRLGLLDLDLARLGSRRPGRRTAAAANLETLAIPGTLRCLLPLLDDRDTHARMAAVRAAGRIGSREALAALVPRLGDASPSVSRQAQDILAESGRGVADEIRTYLRATDSRRAQYAAVELLGWFRAPESAELLLDLMGAGDAELRIKAVKAAAAIGDPRFLDSFHALLADPRWELRAQAAKGLGGLGSPASIPALKGLLADPQWWVRYSAALALADQGVAGEVALEDALADPRPVVRDIPRYVLERRNAMPARP
jgi:HEAT repeat protein